MTKKNKSRYQRKMERRKMLRGLTSPLAGWFKLARKKK